MRDLARQNVLLNKIIIAVGLLNATIAIIGILTR